MKKLFFSRGKVELVQVPMPVLTPGTVLIKTANSFVSRGTELATLKNNNTSLLEKIVKNGSEISVKILDLLRSKGLTSTMYQVKSVLCKKIEAGYASSGTVVASSSKSFREGEIVSCAGFALASHSEYVVVPARMLSRVKNPEKLADCSAASIVAIALQGLRRANMQMGESICVIGLGLLGLFTVQLAKLSGLKVIGVDLNQDRLNLALQFGADKVFSGGDWDERLDLFTSRLGVDAVLLSASSAESGLIDKAIFVCRKKGKIIVLGDVPFEFAREEFYKKELDLLVSCSYGPGRYDIEYEAGELDYPYAYVRWTEGRNLQYVTDLISEGKIDVESLVSGEFGFDQAEEAYQCLQDGGLGVIFYYQSQEEPERIECKSEPEERDFVPALSVQKKDFTSRYPFKTMLVGAGGFAKTIMAPVLTRLEMLYLDTVVDISATSLVNFKKTFGFAKVETNFTKALLDEEIDLVILTTPDQMHFSQTIEALSKKKAVFVEKPMVHSWQELADLQKYLLTNPDHFFAVDFNRSYSPMISKIYNRCKNRSTPMIINYRVNSGMVLKDDVLKNSHKRLLGEICHFFEMFLFLMNSQPKKMSVSFSSAEFDSLEENLTLSLVFADGSIANLVYSSLAHEALGKERGEFFWDKKSAVLDDYTSLVGYGLGKNFDQYDLVPDKGHAALLSSFIFSLNKNDTTEFSVQWQRYFFATTLSLRLQDMLLENGGVVNLDEEQLFFKSKVKPKIVSS